MLSNMPFIGNGILNQCICVITATLSESFIAFIQIDTIALCPCRNPCKVFRMRFTIREIQVIM